MDWSKELVKQAVAGDIEKVKECIWNKAKMNDYNNYAFILACAKGHLEVVKYLIEQGADVAVGNNSAIAYASQFNHEKVIECLIENGAEITSDDFYPVCRELNEGCLDIDSIIRKYG